MRTAHEHGAPPGVANTKTALHMSIQYGYWHTAKWMLDNGFDPEITNGEGHKAGNGIDGSTSNLCHTAGGDSDPWLSIDLGSAVRVDSIVVYNRASCCQGRLSPFEVWVGSSAGDTSGIQCGGGAQT